MTAKSCRRQRIRESRFPMWLFWTVLGLLLLVAGIHMGLLLGMQAAGFPAVVLVHIIVLYWVIVSVGLTLFIWGRVEKIYDQPVRQLSEMSKQVAKGDFSVRMEPLHTGEQMDYLDRMIVDINTMIEELGSLETLKTDFISNVSHEMKTPLAVIKSYSDLMLVENLTEDRRREYSTVISETTGKMSDLITNVLKLDKLEHQKISQQPRAYDLCHQLADCIIGFEDRWEAKNIELDVDMDDEALVLADEELMNLVWNNLLSNAVKFTEPAGTITIRQRSTKNQQIVFVQDSGCGMSEETQKHLFDKFYQGDTSHSTEGNGLGLALVQRVLTICGGTIEVASVEGTGSTFTVKLPRASE